MTKFDADEKEHSRSNFMFDDHQAIAELRRVYPDIDFNVIRDKDEARLKNMVEELTKSTQTVVVYQNNAVSFVMMDRSELEQYMKMAGLPVEGKKVGVTICKQCLDRAINLTEENLSILKDIRDHLKR